MHMSANRTSTVRVMEGRAAQGNTFGVGNTFPAASMSLLESELLPSLERGQKGWRDLKFSA